ncbi:MAG: peptidylprolyl isomerase [Holosporales bacterium]|jgi:parvulin-like peptidyl-prolyl isomerase|nr:peptidylprolyl isomerase [Holosporales bacterium]
MNFVKVLSASLFFVACCPGVLCGTTDIDISKVGKTVDEYKFYSEKDDENDDRKLKIFSTKTDHKLKVRSVYTGNTHQSNMRIFIVAKVNKDVITSKDIMNTICFIFFSSGKSFSNKEAKLMVQSVLAKEIDGKLQEQVAARNKMKISEKDIDEQIKGIASRNNLTEEELEKRFKDLGINMQVFRKNIASKMLFSFIIKAMKNDVHISPDEILKEKKKSLEKNKSTRYHLYEIHLRVTDQKSKDTALKNAEILLKLLNDGFNFQVLAESISQGRYPLQIGDLGWVSEKDMEKSVLQAVQKLRPGEFSGIIESNSGIKIVYLEDRATPNKKGSKEAVYKYIKVTARHQGGIMTSKDSEKVVHAVEELKAAKTPDAFKEVCKKYKLEFEEKEESVDNPLLIMVLDSSMKGANTAESMEGGDFVDVFYTISKKIPDSEEASTEEVEHDLMFKFVMKNFQRSFKQTQNVAFVKIFEDRVKELTK